MKVLVVGANGKIGRQLVPRLVEDGHTVHSLLREKGQAEFHEKAGARPVIGDLEESVAAHLQEMDACVFTAGSGGDTGKDKTLLVDLWGAWKTIAACHEHGVRRYLMVSARRAGNPDGAGEGIRPYLVAKHAADERLRSSGLDFTILRPGSLSDDEGTGRIVTGSDLSDREGSIPRADVAASLAFCLQEPRTVGLVVEMLSGDQPIEEALVSPGD